MPLERASVAAAPVRLVALDLDGTILEGGQRLAPAVVAALRTLAGRGVPRVTATGRPLAFQLALLARHGLGADAGVPAARGLPTLDLHHPDQGGHVASGRLGEGVIEIMRAHQVGGLADGGDRETP